MYQLHLPPPPAELIASIIAEDWYKEEPVDSPLLGGKEINNFELLLANYQVKLYNDTTLVNQLINELYSSIFGAQLSTAVLSWTNQFAPTHTAQAAPHCDKLRSIGINFLIESGGATTTLYKERRKSPDLTFAEYTYYRDLTIDKVYQIAENSWYVFDNQQYHSIESINTRRILLAVLPVNAQYDQTISKISNLLTPLPSING